MPDDCREKLLKIVLLEYDGADIDEIPLLSRSLLIQDRLHKYSRSANSLSIQNRLIVLLYQQCNFVIFAQNRTKKNVCIEVINIFIRG